MKQNNNKSSNRPISGRLLFAALIVVFLGGVLYASYNLISTEADYNAAREEYTVLREMAPQVTAIIAEPPVEEDIDDIDDTEVNEIPEYISELSKLNPDYIGWIRIDGTSIDYPVVQGKDNDKYMNTTFIGERNPSGTIFLDSNCKNGFDEFALIHGHNMRDGSMFAGLHSLLDRDFLANNREITIITSSGETLRYFILDTKLTDIHDDIFNMPGLGRNAMTFYFSFHGFSEEEFDTGIDIITLATCTNNHRDERLLVFAFRHK